MEDSTWAKQIARNMSEIKERVPAVLDLIIDYLISKAIIPISRRSDIDAIGGPSSRIDHILQLTISHGVEAYHILLEAFEKNGLHDLAEMIRSTIVPTREVSVSTLYEHGEMDGDDDWLERTMSICSSLGEYETPQVRQQTAKSKTFLTESVEVLESRQDTFDMRLERLETEIRSDREILKAEKEHVRTERDELKKEREKIRNDNEKHFKKIERQLDKEKEELQREKEEMRRINEELRSENRALNSKFLTLADEFSAFKSRSNKETADSKRKIEQLKQKNKELQQELNNTKRRLTVKTTELEVVQRHKMEMKMKLDEKAMALKIMNNCFQNTGSAKRARNLLNHKLKKAQLPPISKQAQTEIKLK